MNDSLLPKMLTRQVVGRLPLALWPSRAQRLPLSLKSLRTQSTVAQSPSPNDLFANGTNTYYADEMYRLWKQDRHSVHPSWDVYFSGLDKGLTSPQAFQPPPSAQFPHPADGAPALHVGQGAELDDHLKASTIQRNLCPFLTRPLGPTSGSSIPSPRSSRCRTRSSWYP